MKNYNNLPQQLGRTIQISNIKQSLAVAFERTQSNPINIDLMADDIMKEFKFLKIEDFTKAIRNGSLGKYGRTYKLSTQEVCIWIREYLKETKSKIGL